MEQYSLLNLIRFSENLNYKLLQQNTEKFFNTIQKTQCSSPRKSPTGETTFSTNLIPYEINSLTN